MKRSALIASGTALILGISAVAAVGVAPSFAASEDGKRDRHACFDPNWVRGFQTTDSHTVIITSSQDQVYELKLGGVCIGLESSMQFGIRSRHGMSDVCGPMDADIVYDDLGRGQQSCPIMSVRHLQGEEAAPYTRTARSDKKDEREKTRVNSGRDGR